MTEHSWDYQVFGRKTLIDLNVQNGELRIAEISGRQVTSFRFGIAVCAREGAAYSLPHPRHIDPLHCAAL